MKTVELTLPHIALIAGTRGMAGAGLGLVLADHLSDHQRRSVGWTLFIVGALSTIPLAMAVISQLRAGNVQRSGRPSAQKGS